MLPNVAVHETIVVVGVDVADVVCGMVVVGVTVVVVSVVVQRCDDDCADL